MRDITVRRIVEKLTLHHEEVTKKLIDFISSFTWINPENRKVKLEKISFYTDRTNESHLICFYVSTIYRCDDAHYDANIVPIFLRYRLLEHSAGFLEALMDPSQACDLEELRFAFDWIDLEDIEEDNNEDTNWDSIIDNLDRNASCCSSVCGYSETIDMRASIAEDILELYEILWERVHEMKNSTNLNLEDI